MRKELIRAFKSLNTIKIWNGIERTDILAWLEKQGRVKESAISQHEIETCKENDDSLTSDDEKVIDAIKHGLKCLGWEHVDGIKISDMNAWLEKQGDYANFRDKAQIGDRITKNEAGVLVNLSQLKRVAKPSEKQGEQKPVDKDEPKSKFKVGDEISVHTLVKEGDKERTHVHEEDEKPRNLNGNGITVVGSGIKTDEPRLLLQERKANAEEVAPQHTTPNE